MAEGRVHRPMTRQLSRQLTDKAAEADQVASAPELPAANLSFVEHAAAGGCQQMVSASAAATEVVLASPPLEPDAMALAAGTSGARSSGKGRGRARGRGRSGKRPHSDLVADAQGAGDEPCLLPDLNGPFTFKQVTAFQPPNSTRVFPVVCEKHESEDIVRISGNCPWFVAAVYGCTVSRSPARKAAVQVVLRRLTVEWERVNAAAAGGTDPGGKTPVEDLSRGEAFAAASSEESESEKEEAEAPPARGHKGAKRAAKMYELKPFRVVQLHGSELEMKPAQARSIKIKFNENSVRTLGKLVQTAFTESWTDGSALVVMPGTDLQCTPKFVAEDAKRVSVTQSSPQSFRIRFEDAAGQVKRKLVHIHFTDRRGKPWTTQKELEDSVHDCLVHARTLFNANHRCFAEHYNDHLLD